MILPLEYRQGWVDFSGDSDRLREGRSWSRRMLLRSLSQPSRQSRKRNAIARDCNPDLRKMPNQFIGAACYRPRADWTPATSALLGLPLGCVECGVRAGT